MIRKILDKIASWFEWAFLDPEPHIKNDQNMGDN